MVAFVPSFAEISQMA